MKAAFKGQMAQSMNERCSSQVPEGKTALSDKGNARRRPLSELLVIFAKELDKSALFR